MSAYQVVAECAHVTLESPYGKAVTLLMKGAMVPADAPQLQHLLDIGAVAKVDDGETGGVDAAGVPAGGYSTGVPAGITTTPVEKSEEQRNAEAEAAEQRNAEEAKAKADAETAEKREAAKAKLPADGSEPDGRASQAVWVEYLLVKHPDRRYDDLKDAEKAELQKLAKQQS